ncbi:MAG: mechanosensitive ion channel [Salinivirgaceae bacterium]|jgi:small-conductance mechanosensitive channel|nr:mechanosensitive ion channel [Salinivirgaceae bacterium]
MDEIYEFIKSATGLPTSLQIRIFKTLLIGTVIYFASRLAVNLVNRWVANAKRQFNLRKVVRRTAFFIFIILVADLWLLKIGSLATFFGLVSAGLAIALKDPITDMAGWLFIIWRKPFELSDRIEIGDKKGDVVDIRVFQFTLIEIGNWVNADQSTGRVVHIPNASIFKYHLANYTTGFKYIWDEIEVLVTFESDWRAAKSAIEEIATNRTHYIVDTARKEIQNASKKYLIFYKNLTPKVYTSVKDSGILFTARFLVAAKQRRGMTELIWEDILEQFGQNETIDFAYPSVRYYDNKTEGKKPLRAD